MPIIEICVPGTMIPEFKWWSEYLIFWQSHNFQPFKYLTSPLFGSQLYLKFWLAGGPLIAGFVVYEIFAHLWYVDNKKLWRRDMTEERSAELAIEPLLCAERDRELCRAARATRDAEEEAMKNVPGWEVGTWFGHKVFKTIDNP